MKLITRKYLNQTGDTIVEVLVAMAVMSMALGVIYRTASESQKAILASAERGQMLKLAEMQVERLKAYLDTNPGAFAELKSYSSSAAFCIVRDSDRFGNDILTLSGPLTSPDTLNFPNPCALNSQGIFDVDDGEPSNYNEQLLNFPFVAAMTWNYDNSIPSNNNEEFHVFAGKYKTFGNDSNKYQVVNLQFRVKND